jgi:hypothetical protein
LKTPGCTKPDATNRGVSATVDDGSCRFIEQIVSPSGGSATSTDQKVHVTFPPGSVADDDVVIVKDVPSTTKDDFVRPDSHEFAGLVREIELNEGDLAADVTVTIEYDPAAVTNIDKLNLLYSDDGIEWDTAADRVIDELAKTVSGTVKHFSFIVAMEDKSAPEGDDDDDDDDDNDEQNGGGSGSSVLAPAVAGGVIGGVAIAMVAGYLYKRKHANGGNERAFI